MSSRDSRQNTDNISDCSKIKTWNQESNIVNMLSRVLVAPHLEYACLKTLATILVLKHNFCAIHN